MNEGTKNQLNAQLKKMLDNFDQAKNRKKTSKLKAGTGNIIRRRAGEKEKRFSIASTCRQS